MPDFDFVHTGPETLAGRCKRMLRQPVYRSDDLAAGRAVPLRIWQCELAALAAGEQLRKWTRPANLVATTGIAEG